MLSRKHIIIGVLVVIGIPVLLAAWWLLSPLFISKTVEEEFPLAAGAVIPDNMTMEEAEQTMVDAAVEDNPFDEVVPTEMAMADNPSAMDSSVVKVKSGSFRDADSFHKGKGQATIYRSADGANVLRLEDFSVTNGPDLHVLLVPHANPTGRDDIEGYVGLGKLKGNRGNQNYFLPEGDDGSDYSSVVIYCMPFHVIFSVATLN